MSAFESRGVYSSWDKEKSLDDDENLALISSAASGYDMMEVNYLCGCVDDNRVLSWF